MTSTRFFRTRVHQRVGVNPLHLATFIAALAAPLRADTVLAVPTAPGSQLTIKLSSPASSPPRFGFAPIRVTIENAAAQERSWQVAFQVGMRGQFPGVLNTVRTFTVPAGQTRENWVYLPVAEPSTSAGNVIFPGSPAAVAAMSSSGMPPAKVTIEKTSTGTKVTRVMMNPTTGVPFMTEETEIDARTGVLTANSTSPTGGSTSSRRSVPPPGANVTYVIDPDTGSISTRTSMGSKSAAGAIAGAAGFTGPAKVDIITSTNPAASSPAGFPAGGGAGVPSGLVSSATPITPIDPSISVSVRPGGVISTNPSAGLPVGRGAPSSGARVAITQTPVGTKVTRTMGSGASAYTIEQEIDSTTGEMTTTTNLPAGRPSPAPSVSPPRPPGTETTFTIDPTSGYVRTSNRQSADRSAPPKIIIVTGARPGSGSSLISATGPASVPVVMGGAMTPTTITAEVTGPGLTGNRRVSFSGTAGIQMRPFVVSAATEPAVRAQLSAIARGAPNLSTIEPAQLPADWRVWSSFAGVILTSDEYAALDAGRRAALRGWVALGGRIWLSPSAAGAERVEKIGAGLITTLAEPLAAISGEAAKPSAEVQAARDELASLLARNGEGHSTVIMQRVKLATLVVASTNQRVSDFWLKTVQVYGGTPGLPDRNALVLEKTPLGEAAQERAGDTTWLAIFLVAFAAMIGPVNLFVFAPAARRHRLFFTTPLIAFVATVLLGTAIFLQDGLGGDGMRRALVVLLPGENQAAIFQEQTALTGFLPRRSFPLAADTQLTMLPLDASPSSPTMSLGGIAELVRDENSATGDWFRSRGRQAHLVQRLVPTRGRVERVGTGPGGAPVVVSSLGTALRNFVCLDDTSKYWTTADLPPGKRVTLTRGSNPAGTLSLGGSRRFADVLEAATPKAAGRWRANGGASDLAPIATLDLIRWQEIDVIYAGVIEGAAAENKTEATP